MLTKLKPSDLRVVCDPKLFDFDTTKDLLPLSSIIGQERAVKAMEFGLQIHHRGYNIFMTGLTGTGKTSYARSVVEAKAKTEKVPDDIIYVYNFAQPEKPKAIKLPAGMGSEFAKDMEKLINTISKEVTKVLKDDGFEKQRQDLIEHYQNLTLDLLEQLNNIAQDEGFAIQQTPQGIMTVPLKDGDTMKQEEYENLPPEEKKEIDEKSRKLQSKTDDIIRKIRSFDKNARIALNKLEKDTALAVIKPFFDEIAEKYHEQQKILTYIKEVKNDLTENFPQLKKEQKDQEEETNPFSQKTAKNNIFTNYKVNLFVDNKETQGAPVVFETNPTYYNLFGKIEGRAYFGAIISDFTMIKSGALHRANGGYLILQAQDLFKDPFAWDTLKRVLKNGKARVENIGEQYRAFPTLTLKPESIPIDVKVILIGTPYIYHILNTYDEDFSKYFKIKVDFDVQMPRTPENLKDYAAFICSICTDQSLNHFTPEGVARVIDYSSRLAQDKMKLSTQFNDLSEIIYEASTWAKIEKSEKVGAYHVEKAIEEKTLRSNRIEEKLFSMIERGEILIDTTGQVVGQVNGLSVVELGDYTFGQPTKITARVYVGNAGVVNIEREAKMSGRIHNKAVLILEGYLGQKYARDIPLSISASIAFEQNYGGIEGDSASLAELLALLSSIAEIPIYQNIAITGSLNQHGKVQPVGGITYKIEGFYKTCKIQGINNTQGVIIPKQNIQNLMLKQEIVDAARDGKFHIYSVEDFDDIIPIMTGFSPEDFHKKVKKHLLQMATIHQKHKTH